jgi:hypothetical protein
MTKSIRTDFPSGVNCVMPFALRERSVPSDADTTEQS